MVHSIRDEDHLALSGCSQLDADVAHNFGPYPRATLESHYPLNTLRVTPHLIAEAVVEAEAVYAVLGVPPCIPAGLDLHKTKIHQRLAD